MLEIERERERDREREREREKRERKVQNKTSWREKLYKKRNTVSVKL
jgi:hypothetical protein